MLAMRDVFDFIKCEYHKMPAMKGDETDDKYRLMTAYPATGILYSTTNSPDYISGHVRLRGKDQGRYPYKILEMIDYIFGKEKNTIEVCSGSVKSTKEGLSTLFPCYTVDINPETEPDHIGDAQTLEGIPDDKFARWRCDPPYNEKTAQEMYGTTLPVTGHLLKAGARVCKVDALLFLLLGPQNYQWCPAGVRRIGWIAITVVPNNELRALHIFHKYSNNA